MLLPVVVSAAPRCLRVPYLAKDAQCPGVPTHSKSGFKAILAAAAIPCCRRRRSSLRYMDAGVTAEWDLAELESWELQGVYRDPSDPREGSVQLYFDAGCEQARMLHSEYGPVPVELKIITKADGLMVCSSIFANRFCFRNKVNVVIVGMLSA